MNMNHIYSYGSTVSIRTLTNDNKQDTAETEPFRNDGSNHSRISRTFGKKFWWSKRYWLLLLGSLTALIFVSFSLGSISMEMIQNKKSINSYRPTVLAKERLQTFLNEPAFESQMYHKYKDTVLSQTTSSSPLFTHIAPSIHKHHHIHFPLFGSTRTSRDSSSPWTDTQTSSPPPPTGCEGTVILIRHCEKTSIRNHCAYIGYQRAIYLSTLFGSTPTHRWPKPSFLFALTAGERHGNPKSNTKQNWREIETLLPLSKAINVTIDDSYGTQETETLATHILTRFVRTGTLCGKVALISWKHDDLPHLAHSLGCAPEDGCPEIYPSTTFDDAWQIKFAYHVPIRYDDDPLTSSLQATNGWDKESIEWSKEVPQWFVYGTVLQEGFDPLAFSKKMGEYNDETTHKGEKQSGSESLPFLVATKDTVP